MNDIAGISIIICTWNRSVSLLKTLESLQQQVATDTKNIELLVVDNNSTDNTKAVVEKLSKNWTLGSLTYAFEPKQGKQFALNKGISLAKYDILAFTDDDILFSNNWLTSIVDVFEDETSLLVGGKTLLIWPGSGQPKWFSSSMSAIVGGIDLGDKRVCPAQYQYTPAGANLIVRRSLFERVGYFSEAHFRHMDHEFGVRSSKMAVNISYEPTLVVYAPVDEACLTRRYFRRWSFKAGIADDGESNSSEATLLYVPRWVYRQLIDDLCFFIFRSFFVNSSVAFSRELRIWRMTGMVISSWYKKVQPVRHSEWIEKFSQKNNGLY